jgi:hypothetical protein
MEEISSPKRWFIRRLHATVSQKLATFITTAVRASNPNVSLQTEKLIRLFSIVGISKHLTRLYHYGMTHLPTWTLSWKDPTRTFPLRGQREGFMTYSHGLTQAFACYQHMIIMDEALPWRKRQHMSPKEDSLRYQILWEVVGLERGPLSLAITNDHLHGRKIRGSCLETKNTAVEDPPLWLRDIPLSAKVGTNFADKRTQTTEFVVCLLSI